jgi:dihydroneopterin aldolase
MDKVFIEGLTIDALIGIYDWERRIRQDLVFDLEMGFDNRRPAATDDIAHTLNYKAVSKRLEQFVRESEFGLVETLAERCAQIVLDEFDVKWLRLKLSKPGAVRGARGGRDHRTHAGLTRSCRPLADNPGSAGRWLATLATTKQTGDN